MAWSSVIANKLRSFLTMLGIVIGVVALVVLVSMAQGATSQVHIRKAPEALCRESPVLLSFHDISRWNAAA